MRACLELDRESPDKEEQLFGVEVERLGAVLPFGALRYGGG